MKICHILEAAGGGSGQVVLDLIRAECVAGDEVTLIYSPSRAQPNFVAALSALPNLKIITTPMQRAVGLHDLRDGWKLFKAIQKAGRFDIIHSHSSKAGALARLAGIFIANSKQVYTPHAFMTMSPHASPLYGWIEWGLSWFCDKIIATSLQEQQHAIHKLKISANKLVVIPNGIALDYPADRAKAREQLGLKNTDFAIGFVGRLAEQKNPMRAIEAFIKIAEKQLSAKLVVIGSGDLVDAMRHALQKAGLEDRASFLGDTTARDYMPAFDCLLGSSDYESFGLIMVEALAAGVPVVTTKVGIAEAAVTEDKTGYITGFDAGEIAKAVQKIIALSDGQRQAMSQTCIEQAKNFSADKMARTTKTLYQSLLIN